MAVSKERIAELAIEAGFHAQRLSDLYGESPDDEIAYVAEYPCGERLIRFAELLLAEASKAP